MVQGIQSIEPNIADLANGWSKPYGLDHKLEQERLNTKIDKPHSEYFINNGESEKELAFRDVVDYTSLSIAATQEATTTYLNLDFLLKRPHPTCLLTSYDHETRNI